MFDYWKIMKLHQKKTDEIKPEQQLRNFLHAYISMLEKITSYTVEECKQILPFQHLPLRKCNQTILINEQRPRNLMIMGGEQACKVLNRVKRIYTTKIMYSNHCTAVKMLV